MQLQKSPNWDVRKDIRTYFNEGFPFMEGFPEKHEGKTFTVITTDGAVHRGSHVYTGNSWRYKGTIEWNFLDGFNQNQRNVICWIEESEDSKTEADIIAQMLHAISACTVPGDNHYGVGASVDGNTLTICASGMYSWDIKGSFDFIVSKITDRPKWSDEEVPAELKDFDSTFNMAFAELMSCDPDEEITPNASVDYDPQQPGQFTFSCSDGMGDDSHHYVIYFTSVLQDKTPL